MTDPNMQEAFAQEIARDVLAYMDRATLPLSTAGMDELLKRVSPLMPFSVLNSGRPPEGDIARVFERMGEIMQASRALLEAEHIAWMAGGWRHR